MAKEKRNISELCMRAAKGKTFEGIRFSQGRVERPFDMRSRLSDCVFYHCEFEEGSLLKRVDFNSCTFRDCVFGNKRDPVSLRGVRFRNCLFEDCDLSIWETDGKGAAEFLGCSVEAGCICYFNFKNADFSGTTIRSTLKEFCLSDCFGSKLDISGSRTMDGIIFGPELFETLILPKDEENGFWRHWQQIFSMGVYDALKGDMQDPIGMRERVDITNSNPDFILAYVTEEVLEYLFDLKSLESVGEALQVLRAVDLQDRPLLSATQI